jgi:hypothetical protein
MMKFSPLTKDRVACFLVPVLTAGVLLYKVLAHLQIALTHTATLAVVATVLAVAAILGSVAAFGSSVVRVLVLAASTILFLDVTFHLGGFFGNLKPDSRKRLSRDEKRIADLHKIKAALDQYIAQVGPLPMPADYGEPAGTPGFWQDWWDISSEDVDGDGILFLDFLVEAGILPSVPVDPANKASAKGDPRGGRHFVYFVVPAGYDYEGGLCDPKPNRWYYAIGISKLEDKVSAPMAGSGCPCIWRKSPNFLSTAFDYVLCGEFEATTESRAKAAAELQKRATAYHAATVAAKALAAKQAEAIRLAKEGAELQARFGAVDNRRVADIRRIQHGLQSYIAQFGPLPAPRDYGEADSFPPGFWQGYWDLSGEDADQDGKPFLDFLVDSGVMPSVPRDPENSTSKDRDPRGGRQYVYFVASADEPFGGGTCGKRNKKWVYMLGITDLQSEASRPPARIKGSGCECLWKDSPNLFQSQFDYVVCGTFDSTPEARARSLETLRARNAQIESAKRAVELEKQAAKDAAERLKFVPQDERRVADINTIRQALRTYIEKVGPPPAPREYGEKDRFPSGFWGGYWDLSSEDADGDGRPFLDFLVEKGILTSVPVDPENKGTADGDPRGGRQYVFFVASPDDPFGEGPCSKDKREWVYLLGITDLRSEGTRPPAKMEGSGCDCLWSKVPNLFQSQFDYVVCDTFVKPEAPK